MWARFRHYFKGLMFSSWIVVSCTLRNRIVIYCANNPDSGSMRPMQAIRTEPTGASDVKILLDVDDLPRAWYNILPDLPAPFPPYLHRSEEHTSELQSRQ